LVLNNFAIRSFIAGPDLRSSCRDVVDVHETETLFWFARQPSHVPGATLVDPLLKESARALSGLRRA